MNTRPLPSVMLRCESCQHKDGAVCVSKQKAGQYWSEPCRKCGGSMVITRVFS